MSLLVKSIDEGSIAELESVMSNMGVDSPISYIDEALEIFEIKNLEWIAEEDNVTRIYIKGWKATLDKWENLSEHTKVVCCAIAVSRFKGITSEQSVLGLSIPKSKNEAAIRGFSTCYFYGRSIINNRSLRESARFSMEESFKFSDYVDERNSHSNRLKKFRGQLGVGKLFLARGRSTEQPIELLRSALTDLEASRKYGDESPNHYSYEVETIARILSIDHCEKLEEKGLYIAENVQISIESQAYAVADLYLGCGIFRSESDNFACEKLEVWFDKAIENYSLSIDLAKKRNKPSEQYLAKRGYAKLRKMTTSKSNDSIEELNTIVEDLVHAKPNYYTGYNPFPTALFWRASYYEKNGDYSKAIKDLERSLKSDIPKVANKEILDQVERTKLALSTCKLQLSIENSLSSKVIENLKDVIHFSIDNRPSIPVIASAIRFFADNDLLDQELPLVRSSISYMNSIRELPDCIGEARAFASSYIAGAMLRLKDHLTIDELKRVCSLYAQIHSLGDIDPAPELFGLAGEAKLRLAKMLRHSRDSAPEVRQLLTEACELFEKSKELEESKNKQVSSSKLGETYLRLHSLTHIKNHLLRSIEYLESSEALGNTEPELYGLLGDAYYRLGYTSNNLQYLEKAINLKAKSRKLEESQGLNRGVTREHFSLVSRIYFQIWRLTSNRRNLSKAVSYSLTAIAKDSDWPWPYFQLAEYVQYVDTVLCEEAINRNELTVDTEVREALLSFDADKLNFIGARGAAINSEFGKEILGGRLASVYLLDDPHRLLSNTIVLKKGSKLDIERDSSRSLELTNYLNQISKSKVYKAPNSLGVIEKEGAFIYVMGLEKGRDLGSVILDTTVSSDAKKAHGLAAAELLSYFHGWAWTENLAKVGPDNRSLNGIYNRSIKWFSKVGVSESITKRFRNSSKKLYGSQQLLLLKKDAHPENWIVGIDNTLTVIDLENSAFLPVLFDLCQLIDDYPLVGFDTASQKYRSQAINLYLNNLCDQAPMITQHVQGLDLERIYCCHMVARTAFGMGRIALKLVGETDVTSSSLKGNRERFVHYISAARWLSNHFDSDPIGDASGILLEIAESLISYNKIEVDLSEAF